MDLQKAFDVCVEQAILLGRKHMEIDDKNPKPTKEEWQLALVLFDDRLNKYKTIK